MTKPRDHRAVMSSRQPTDADDPDFFPTEPWGGRAIGELVKQLDPLARTVWEPACGAGHLVHGLKDYFPTVWGSDKFAYDGNPLCDFLAEPVPDMAADWIITNPPFRDGMAETFIRLAYGRARRGVAILGDVGLLRSIGRYSLLYRDCPLTIFAPFSERLALTKGRWDPGASSAAFYAWFVWLRPELKPRRFMARICGESMPGVWPIAPGTEARLTHPDDAQMFGAVDRSRGAAA